MTQSISIKIVNPNNEKVLAITEELSENLYLRFGSDGKNSFQDWENENSKFVLADVLPTLIQLIPSNFFIFMSVSLYAT